MTNQELAAKRAQLRQKSESIAGRNPMMAMADYVTAAMMMAEITDELTRRELTREAAPHE